MLFLKEITKKYYLLSIFIISNILTGCNSINLNSSKLESFSTPSKNLSENLQNNIKNSTVIIKRESDYSSGVIISRIDNKNIQNNSYTYHVLTTRHSVKGVPRPISISESDSSLDRLCYDKPQQNINKTSEVACDYGFYYIYTNDGKQHPVNYSSVVKFSKKLDLALVKFESKNKYIVASMASKLPVKKDSPVYVSGYRGCTQSNLYMSEKYELTSGFIEKKPIMSSAILYTNPTIKGMSGSGVFNSHGKLIAIHQEADKAKQYNYKNCQPLDDRINDLGSNWGTLVSEFLNQKEIPEEVKTNYKECSGLFSNSKCPK